MDLTEAKGQLLIAGDAVADAAAAQQKAADEAAFALVAAGYQKRIDDLQARLDALQPKMLIGANVGPLADQALYPAKLDVTRVYYSGSQSNITTGNGGVRAKAGAYNPQVMLSSHAGTNAAYDSLCGSPKDTPAWEDWMIRQHEPEGKTKEAQGTKGLYTIAQWQTEQRRASVVARSNGFKFGTCLMAGTVLIKYTNGRSFSQYMSALDEDLFDFFCFDYYPYNTLNIPIADAVSRLQDEVTKWGGDKPWVMAEFGVRGALDGQQAVDQVGQLLDALPNTNCTQASYFSVDECALTPAVRDACFNAN